VAIQRSVRARQWRRCARDVLACYVATKILVDEKRALYFRFVVDRQRTRRERTPAPPVATTSSSQVHPIGTPSGLSPNTGPLAAAAWLLARGLFPREPRWFVEVELVASEHTRFVIEIYAEEWGFAFHHHDRVSWIRVTDIAFVHGRDDHDLLDEAPKLRDIGVLIAKLEGRFGLAFAKPPTIRTSLGDADGKIREWVAALW
jgi:hypothetical protein